MTVEPTFGDKAVGLSSNPGDNMLVNHINQLYAGIIDVLHEQRVYCAQDDNGEVKRMLSVAITEAQTSQMWAVKAVTWGSP
jgi:hypothetical protein